MSDTPESVVASIDQHYKEAGLSAAWIVCAANRLYYKDKDGNPQTVIVPGARHHDGVMAPIRCLCLGKGPSDPVTLATLDDNFIGEDQGFIDQHGHFYSRHEAWIVAERNGQIKHPTGWLHGRLHSENLY